MGGVALSLGVFWPETTQSSGLWALWLGLMVNGKRVYAKGDLPRLVPPSLWWAAADPSSTEDPPTLAVLVQFPVESLLLSSESLCMQGSTYAL